jgi:hypothetical protein
VSKIFPPFKRKRFELKSFFENDRRRQKGESIDMKLKKMEYI